MNTGGEKPFDEQTRRAFRRLSEKSVPFAEIAQDVVEYHGLKE